MGADLHLAKRPRRSLLLLARLVKHAALLPKALAAREPPALSGRSRLGHAHCMAIMLGLAAAIAS